MSHGSSDQGPGRVLVAKPGLDGHDRGAKLVARALRDGGLEVIYTGLRQRPRVIAVTAVQEDVHVIGLSVLSGSHLELTEQTIRALHAMDGGDIAVVIGGTIPHADCAKLTALGAAAVFPTGADIGDVVATVKKLVADRRAERGDQGAAGKDAEGCDQPSSSGETQ